MKVRIHFFVKFVVMGLCCAGLIACTSDDDESDNNQGLIKFYNVSANSPAIHLTIDEHLDTNEEDELEVTFSSVGYATALSAFSLSDQDYFYELAWQDGDSAVRSELKIIQQGEISIARDTLHLMVLSDDVTTPNVLFYEVPVIDDDSDNTYSLFNFNVLNVSEQESNIDVYVSKSGESFNEAELIGSYTNNQLSENQKFEQGSYIFYVTYAGSEEVLYQSDAIDYYYSAQYIMAFRKNTGVGSSPFIMDKVSNSNIVEYIDFDAEAQFKVYNAIGNHDLLLNYQNQFSLYLNEIDDEPEIADLSYGQLSDVLEVERGDYSLSLLTDLSNEPLASHHLLSLSENANKTVFFYADVENVDEDNDGNVDENGDGIVDQKEVTIHSLVVDSNMSDSIYGHEISTINLVDNDDFSLINIYFVRSDETIDTAIYKRSLSFAQHDSIYMNNNTYQVYVVAQQNSSDVILSTFELTLDETSSNQFIVVETQPESTTGYKASLFSLNSE